MLYKTAKRGLYFRFSLAAFPKRYWCLACPAYTAKHSVATAALMNAQASDLAQIWRSVADLTNPTVVRACIRIEASFKGWIARRRAKKMMDWNLRAVSYTHLTLPTKA